MTEDVKATRLSKAAREFNVGISTIIEFLHKKGFVLDPNPNTKLPHEAYQLLVKEYSPDISAKKESEKLILRDLHRNKVTVSIDDVPGKTQTEEPEREEEILVKDTTGAKIDIKPEIKKPDIKLVGKIDLEKTLKPKVEKPVPPKEEEKEKKPSKPAPEPVKADKPEKKKTEPEKPVAVKEEVEKVKAGIDLHIVGKIDLETITKEPKTPVKEEVAAKHREKEEEKSVVSKEKVAVVPEEIIEPLPQPAEAEVSVEEVEEIIPEQEEIVELFRPGGVTKLSGPTVVGKIDLPVEEKKKGPAYQPVKVDGESDFRRKKRRKRITKEKEQVPVSKPEPIYLLYCPIRPS